MLIVDALRIKRDKRSSTVDQWWELRKQEQVNTIRIEQKMQKIYKISFPYLY